MNAKVPASQIFERDLAILCRRYAGMNATITMQARLRREVEELVRWLYDEGGYVFDSQDRTPIATADEVHVVVRFHHEARELKIAVERRRGRMH